MEEDIVNDDTQIVETDEQKLETADSEELSAVALKAELEKTKETNKQLFERAKKAEAKTEKVKIERKAEAIVEKRVQTGELDETQLDYLDLKGVTDEAEIEIIHNVMKRTGQTVRQALKDDYVEAKLAKLRKDKEVQDATPGATRRPGGSPNNNLDYAYAKYEQTGELPTDFKLRSEVINKRVAKESTSTPPWHK